MKRLATILVVTTLLLLVLSPATVNAKDNWTSVRSKNFFLIGNGSEKEIKQVAARLEQFREVFTRVFPKIKFSTPVPTTVIVFKSESSFRPFKPGANTAGYFQPGPDVNYIALTTELQGEQDAFNVIFHEYTHLLVDNTIGNAPSWFNEGLAEYYSTFKISDDQKIVLGAPIGNHVYLLRQNKMLPLATLFQVDHNSPYYNERNKQGIFYAQSWALMHYMIIGKQGRVEQLGKFIELIGTDVPMAQAFQQAFQTTYDVIEKELRDYVKQDRYNIMKGHFEQKLETEAGLQTAPISEAGAQAYLGDLMLHSNRKESITYLQKALTLDPTLALAHASIGMALIREGKINEAVASLERAVNANTQNYLIHYYYAFALSRIGDGKPVSGYPPEVVARIYDEVNKAIALRPDYPESYKLLAFVSMVTNTKVEESIALLKKALVASPGRSDFIFMLGQLYLRTGDYKSSRQLLEHVVKSNAEDETKQRAQSMLAQLSSYEEQKQRFDSRMKERNAPASSTRPEPVIVTTTEPEKASDPSNYLREVLRKRGEGETQSQGTLLRIECETKTIVFVVQVGEKVLRLRTNSFEDMEITSYNPDVKGDITCGTRKAEESVVVCFVLQPDPRGKTDGSIRSIEFVPRNFKL